jgi:hypothetical protein
MTRTRAATLAILLYAMTIICALGVVAGLLADRPVWVIALRFTGMIGCWISASMFRDQASQ